MKSLLYALAFAVAAVTVAPAQATGRLDKIKSTGEIAIGYRDSAIPFSYLDDHQKSVGYSMDICQGIVDALQKDLNIPHIKVKLIPVVGSTRIPLIANGTIDLSCGPDTNNAQRQTQVSFAPTTYVSATRFVALKSSHLDKLSDFKGKTVVSVSGSTNLKWLTEANAKEDLGMRIIAAPDHSDAFQTVASGRASAFFMDDILLAGLVANSHDPHDWVISRKAFTVEPYGIIEPKGDPQFKAAVDQAVAAMMKDGKIEVLYKKWFTQPIPPRNVNLNWPMSAELKKVIAHPTDSPDPADYR
ncbi:MAG TPA: amino acid ABC transporter substrate-binding protein [Castellaniella sp.]|uniref:amino acid ABC transporter substrate-binding protein n=1 Tax=Castellaniella sp. TaxID=1955812 RepID=UPI002EF4C4AB